MKKLILFPIVFLLVVMNVYTDQWGLASWYGGDFHGKKTANGEIFNTNEHTAAHRTLPFNTVVKVTNLYNLKATLVRINDRGPFRKGRIIDLSKAAAADLDMLDSGVIPVRIEIVEKTKDEEKIKPVETAETVVPVEPVEPVAGIKSYRIQIGAFREVENAERAKRLITAKNLSVAVESTEKGFLRVYVDNISKDALKQTEKILHDLGFHDFIIRER
ncbi:MAG: septal ring lytic transglycosylase RlpA family protein [Spirochaetales bacterium]|nr:septal ring lytic transglycosylase RlpA family protein [Spirochaetales bacterium]